MRAAACSVVKPTSLASSNFAMLADAIALICVIFREIICIAVSDEI